MALAPSESRKPLDWVGSPLEDLGRFLEPVQSDIGYALDVAQKGGNHPSAKPWKGQGPGVFELVENHDGDTYRAVHTVRFEDAVYVLHAFQKKSPTGIKTARPNVELIERRLRAVQQTHEARHAKRKR